jgi:hypothetical protein
MSSTLSAWDDLPGCELKKPCAYCGTASDKPCVCCTTFECGLAGRAWSKRDPSAQISTWVCQNSIIILWSSCAYGILSGSGSQAHGCIREIRRVNLDDKGWATSGRESCIRVRQTVVIMCRFSGGRAQIHLRSYNLLRTRKSSRNESFFLPNSRH